VEQPGSERQEALQQLLVLAGLRKRLATLVRNEVQKMPLVINILENEVLGPVFREGYKKGEQKGFEEGWQEGREEGREEGRQEGRQEGELTILRRFMEKRFGPLPGWAEERLAGLSTEELDALSNRLLEAGSLEELLK
jgi:predicted transposase YdaD